MSKVLDFQLACRCNATIAAKKLFKSASPAMKQQMFIEACRFGPRDLVVYMKEHRTWFKANPEYDLDYAVVVSAKNNHLDIIRWISTFHAIKLKVSDVCAILKTTTSFSVVQWILDYCLRFDASVYKWHDTPQLPCIKNFYYYDVMEIFVHFLKRGRVEILEILDNVFPNRISFEEICRCSHLVVAQWFHGKYPPLGITRSDRFYKQLHGDYPKGIRRSACSSDSEDEQYLSHEIEDWFKIACKFNNVQIARWCYYTYETEIQVETVAQIALETPFPEIAEFITEISYIKTLLLENLYSVRKSINLWTTLYTQGYLDNSEAQICFDHHWSSKNYKAAQIVSELAKIKLPSREKMFQVFQSACRRGHFESAIWLYKECPTLADLWLDKLENAHWRKRFQY